MSPNSFAQVEVNSANYSKLMTHTNRTGHSPTSAVPSYSQGDLSIRDILEKWVGTDETLRAALNAHSSSSNRRAEEERTRQEYYRLETRKVEYELLREACRGGIHPSLIPQLFSQERGTQHLSPMSPIVRHDERSIYPTSSLPSHSRPELPRIDTSNIPPPSSRHLAPLQRDKYAGPISAPPASMATTSPPPSIFFRHWAPPQPRTTEDIEVRAPREELDHLSSSRYYHPPDQLPSPSTARKSPPGHSNGISPKRTSHGRPRSEAGGPKSHESRHHPYSRPLQGKKNDSEDTASGSAKSPLDRETVMRALREKCAPRKEEEKKAEEARVKESEKKDAERKKAEQTRDAMALEQLVESNGAQKE